MPENRFVPRHWVFFHAIVVIAFASVVLGAPAKERIHFVPKFVAGESLRYRIAHRSVTNAKTTTPIANPEGETSVSESIGLLVRLDVLDPPKGAAKPGDVRFRATYEQSQADSQTDAFNPSAPSLKDRYARLQGNSIEFTIEPSGELVNLSGLDDIFPNRSETDPILSWVRSISGGSRLPSEGILIGQKWSNERPLTGAPLTGFIWRMESTYLRDDPCRGGATIGDTPASPAGSDTCAVILTHFEILHHGSSQAESTPEEFRRNGLRTAGTWTGSGESLDSISLASGLLESSTQTSTQDTDYEISSATRGSKIHYVGKIQSQSEITFVSSAGPQPEGR
jgi:hypothetical protein